VTYYEYLANFCCGEEGTISDLAYKAKTSASFPRGKTTVVDVMAWADDHGATYEVYSAIKNSWEMYKQIVKKMSNENAKKAEANRA